MKNKGKITKDNLFAVKSNDYITRIFSNEKEYNEWLEYTNKNGHNMVSFSMIKEMIQTYSAKDRDKSFDKL